MSKAPPVPPQNQSPKGPGDPKHGAPSEASPKHTPHTAEQDRQGNIKQNTTNQGFQQDR